MSVAIRMLKFKYFHFLLVFYIETNRGSNIIFLLSSWSSEPLGMLDPFFFSFIFISWRLITLQY